MAVTFEYRAAHEVAEAIDLLREHGDDAKVLAGGQSLMPLINLGLAQPKILVDINPIGQLDFVADRNGTLALGAVTRHRTVERSDAVRQRCALLAEALPLIGDPQVRNRGTIGGSLAHADPVAEIPTIATCLGATMVLQGPNGAREVAAPDFFLTYLTTALQTAELLTEVRFPAMQVGTGYSFQELVRRKGDFAIVAAAATLGLKPDGTCRDVCLALAGVAPTPLNADAAARALVGQKPTPELLRQVAEAACEGIDPESDVIASADYRRAMAPVFARRALTEALERAQP